MTATVKVRQRGQITLPKSFRRALGVDEDDQIKVELKKGKLIMEPVVITTIPFREYGKKDLEWFIEEDKLSPKLGAKIKKLFPQGFDKDLLEVVGSGTYVPLEKEDEAIEEYLKKKYG